MGFRTIIMLNNDEIDTLERHRYSMADIIALTCRQGKAGELRSDGAPYGQVFESRHHSQSVFYFFHGGELVEVNAETLANDPTLKAVFLKELVSQGIIDE